MYLKIINFIYCIIAQNNFLYTLEYEDGYDRKHELTERQKEYFNRMSQPKEIPEPEPRIIYS